MPRLCNFKAFRAQLVRWSELVGEQGNERTNEQVLLA